MKGHSLLYEGAQPFLYVKTLKGNTVVLAMRVDCWTKQGDYKHAWHYKEALVDMT